MFAIPTSYDDHQPIIIVSAKKGTFVELNTQLSSARFYVGDNSSRIIKPFLDGWRVTNGVESKGYELISDDPVSVYIGTEYLRSYRIPDEIMVRPITADDTEYIVSSYPGTSSSSSYWPNSYFMIIPQVNESLVQVFNFENNIWVQQYSMVLNTFEVMTHDSYYVSDGYTDYTGWRIVSTQPVSVISGHGYADFGRNKQHTCDSMTSTAEMGSHYVTFPVLFGLGTEGYVVRIVGSTTENVNVVISEIGLDEMIPKGGFIEVKSVDSSILLIVSYANKRYTDYILITLHRKIVDRVKTLASQVKKNNITNIM